MQSIPPQVSSNSLHHDHPTKPKNQCPSCTQRFGMVVTSTTEISKMLGEAGKETEYAEAAALIQLVWTVNKNLDRIASALEKLGGAA